MSKTPRFLCRLRPGGWVGDGGGYKGTPLTNPVHRTPSHIPESSVSFAGEVECGMFQPSIIKFTATGGMCVRLFDCSIPVLLPHGFYFTLTRILFHSQTDFALLSHEFYFTLSRITLYFYPVSFPCRFDLRIPPVIFTLHFIGFFDSNFPGYSCLPI